MFGIEDFSKPIVDFTNFEFSQIGEAALFGGAVLLIGMLTIFSVLCILWLCLVVFKLVFHNLPEKRAAKKAGSAAAAVVEEAPVTYTSEDDEIVAVIAAAIAMAESEHSDMKFRVVSFRRV